MLQEIQFAVLSDLMVFQPDVLVGTGTAVGVGQPNAHRIPIGDKITQPEGPVPVRTGDVGNHMEIVHAVAGSDVIRRIRMLPVHPPPLITVATHQAGIGAAHKPISILNVQEGHQFFRTKMISTGSMEFVSTK